MRRKEMTKLACAPLHVDLLDEKQVSFNLFNDDKNK